ncbi:endolytic transglycosylase MltG [Candidatus Microgenomates bacterium]|nr:endolytic transglycosylase MltG [Candidatus Microgenomates bacterium]
MKSKTKTLVSLVIIACIVLFSYLYYKEGTLPVDKSNPKQGMFVIRKGETLTTIMQNLEKEKFIRNKIVFFVLVKQLGIEKHIQAGDYRLTSAMTPREIAKKLTQGSVDVWVTIIEGLRREEIADIITSELGIPEAEFLQDAKEGYLFPDTYLIPRTATSENVHTLLNNTFDAKYTDDIDAKARSLGLTREQVVTLASIVEKEGLGSDRPLVASVLLKRFKQDYPLQADATVQYALGYQPDIKKWWKPVLSLDDLKTKSPYNTYENTGLPPGPICSPGISSIEAVVNADPNTPYMFYLHDKNGKVHPARTDLEHEENIKKYL